jgi:hypothetical protein
VIQFTGKSPGQHARDALLHHDNARAHTALKTEDRIQELPLELLEHPPYSPGFVPSDFHVIDPPKRHLGGKFFADDEEVETEVRERLRQQSKDFYATGFDAMVKRWDKWRIF